MLVLVDQWFKQDNLLNNIMARQVLAKTNLFQQKNPYTQAYCIKDVWNGYS